MPLEMKSSMQENTAKLVLSGALDGNSAPAVREEVEKILNQKPERLVLSLSAAASSASRAAGSFKHLHGAKSARLHQRGHASAVRRAPRPATRPGADRRGFESAGRRTHATVAERTGAIRASRARP